MTLRPFMSTSAEELSVYSSKAISLRAGSDPSIANLAFGEPEFGPPEHLVDCIRDQHLTYGAFREAVKHYEQSRGSQELRGAISRWYLRRYNCHVDPETEILITHGGVEAVALAILCTSDPNDTILVTDPTYMLYTRVIRTLGREAIQLIRRPGSEYLGMLDDQKRKAHTLAHPRALIVNSPENPTGYVISDEEWLRLSTFAEANNLWIIHDEVYDTMAFERRHVPARCVTGLSTRSVLINSFSKKFGVPGLRIGWLCADPKLISLAAKLHDYMYLGVNALSERVALTLINDDLSDAWLQEQALILRQRAQTVVQSLTADHGFTWDRPPLGAMFAFPNITLLSRTLPEEYLTSRDHVAESVSEYLMQERRVAAIPGSIYGSEGNACIRLVLCCAEATLQSAMERLKAPCLSNVTQV